MASAGRILIMPKGTYNASTTYEMLDMVNYNGASWLAKKTVTGIEPSEANSEHWHNLIKITPETIGALSKSGGTVNGDIRIDRGENAGNFASYRTQDGVKKSAKFWAGLNGTAAFGSFDENDNVLGQIVADKNGVIFRNGNDYNLFGGHNKKYGSYLGNGSSAERGVKTGSVGSFMMIWSNQGMGFVSPVGGIFASGTGEIRYIDSYSCHYGSDGQLTLRSDLMLLNKNGVTYNYQCL